MGSQNQTSLMWDRWTVKLDYIVWYSKPCETFCILMLAGYPCRYWNFKLVFWLSNYLSVQCLKLSSVLTMRNNRLWKCIFVTIFTNVIVSYYLSKYVHNIPIWMILFSGPVYTANLLTNLLFILQKGFVVVKII